MARAASSPFDPRMVLGVLVTGAIALLTLLYAIGAGLDGRQDQDGGAHGASLGLNGFAGFARLLEADGWQVSLSRSEARLDDEVLLVLTPSLVTDPEELSKVLEARRHIGPTLVVLPKWVAMPLADLQLPGTKPGWVLLGGAVDPGWVGKLAGLEGTKLAIAPANAWQGLGLSGRFPAPEKVAGFRAGPLVPLVEADGRGAVSYWQDDGIYPVLDAAAGVSRTEDDNTDRAKWCVIFVAEPDLLNNYGMADKDRARAALALADLAMEGQDRLPVVFDLTLPGLGRSDNLLTLAFEPPFLAATLCLLLAGAFVGWRAFLRFGPPSGEIAVARTGKRQLALNGGALVQRARRWHLLGAPYAALVSARIARRLGLRSAEDDGFARALERRGLAAEYHSQVARLRQARRPADLLGAAAALRTIERTLAP